MPQRISCCGRDDNDGISSSENVTVHGGDASEGSSSSEPEQTVHGGDASDGSSSSEPEQSPLSSAPPDTVTIPKADEAEHVFLEALEVVRARLPEGHADIARCMTSKYT